MSVTRRNFAHLFAILLAGAATLAPMAAYAQAAEPDVTEDAPSVETTRQDDGSIIVTARRFVPDGAITASKTSVPLIETPQSVSVISRDQIDLLNFIDVQQAVRYTAGAVGENYGPDLRFDFLRQRGFIPTQYIDGLQAPVSSTIDNVGIDLYGFQAIDILRGPASVLYGTTPPGGIYNLTSRRPSAQFGGEVQAKYGTDDYKQIAGTVTGELTNGLSARLTGLYRDRDSQTDYVTAKRTYAAPAVTYQIGPDTKITGLGYYQWDKVRGDTNGFLPALGVLYPNPVGKVSRGINLGEPDYNFYRREQWGAGYEFTHRFSSALTFTQNTSWRDYDEYQQVVYPTGLGPDNRTVSRANFPSSEKSKQFAIDSRIDANFATGPLEHRLLAGFDYRNYRNQAAFAFGGATSIDLFDPVYSATPIPALTLGAPYLDVRLKQSGLYAQDQIKLNGFILSLAGRQDWVERTSYAFPPVTKTKDDKFTWRVGGTYVSEMGIAPYVSYATSFQPIVGATFDGTLFKPTEGKQWEAGVKYDARGLSNDIKLFATAAIFRIKQSNVATLDPRAGTGGVPANAQVQTGEVTSEGVELELVTRIHEQLSINASYTYTNARVTDANDADQLGARLPATPKSKATLFIDYIKATGPLAGLGGGVGVRYLSSSWGNQSNSLPLVSPATTLFDAALHYDIPGWRLAVNGSNIFDKRYAGRCTPQGCFFGQNRQIIATVTKKF
ncbi:TonB-dependent siderophore receptor [Sphingobium phenoxybenzoativorans]|uniref:TonB-dependent siderophore receptor n=1 Tax=Sphingobium phenoxybenzoativorans TaxID=1592790 RepID=UPI000871EEB5|nr:TonB-dependent siderophore receptor [Sphingobium phenoxybenzoativorans]